MKTYEYLTRARRRVFDWVRPLSIEQYTREFPFGPKTVARTLAHILASEWYYVERISGRDVPPYAEWPIRYEEPPPFAELESAWTSQAERTKTALSGIRDWDTDLEYRVTDDDGVTSIINATPTDIFTQLVLHEVHHRAQVNAMLRQMGVTVDDLDYNAMMYRRREVVS